VLIQLKGMALAVGYSFVVSFVIFKVINLIMPMRVTAEEEVEGLDVSQHNENYTQGTLLVHNSNGILEEQPAVK
ncbi:MAG: ammonia channel protein, partial [Chitinophagaceae bacterium]